MSINGWYYLHENGELIYKPRPEAAADIRESDFARAMWPVDARDRASGWTIIVEGLAAGANASRVFGLATKWGCTDEDAQVYAERVGAKLFKDGAKWCATAPDFVNLHESPAGFGHHAYEALAWLCKALGYKPSKMWGDTFAGLLAKHKAIA